MKTKIVVLIVLTFTSLLHSDKFFKNTLLVISPTTGFSTGIRVGVGFANINKDNVREYSLNYKKELISHVAGPRLTYKKINPNHYCSIYFQMNMFRDIYSERSFFIMKLGGFNSPTFTFATDSGTSIKHNDRIVFLISLGYGYSFKIARKSFIRLSIDIGLQPNIINAGVAMIF